MDRPLLILDLDEALIHSSEAPINIPHDLQTGSFRVHFRPGAREFVASAAHDWHLAVWTSATRAYAEPIVEPLFEGIDLRFFWTRDRCTRRLDHELQEHYWLKNLRKVKRAGFDLTRVLMVDDTPRALEENYGNLVQVTEWRGDPDDDELPALARYLPTILNQPDLRRLEKRTWRTTLT